MSIRECHRDLQCSQRETNSGATTTMSESDEDKLTKLAIKYLEMMEEEYEIDNFNDRFDSSYQMIYLTPCGLTYCIHLTFLRYSICPT
jgi:hypothetical protein